MELSNDVRSRMGCRQFAYNPCGLDYAELG